MPRYKVPVVWSNAGVMSIEAENEEEALLLAKDEQPLPESYDYLTDSFIIDTEHPDYLEIEEE